MLLMDMFHYGFLLAQIFFGLLADPAGLPGLQVSDASRGRSGSCSSWVASPTWWIMVVAFAAARAEPPGPYVPWPSRRRSRRSAWSAICSGSVSVPNAPRIPPPQRPRPAARSPIASRSGSLHVSIVITTLPTLCPGPNVAIRLANLIQSEGAVDNWPECTLLEEAHQEYQIVDAFPSECLDGGELAAVPQRILLLGPGIFPQQGGSVRRDSGSLLWCWLDAAAFKMHPAPHAADYWVAGHRVLAGRHRARIPRPRSTTPASRSRRGRRRGGSSARSGRSSTP